MKSHKVKYQNVITPVNTLLPSYINFWSAAFQLLRRQRKGHTHTHTRTHTQTDGRTEKTKNNSMLHRFACAQSNQSHNFTLPKRIAPFQDSIVAPVRYNSVYCIFCRRVLCRNQRNVDVKLMCHAATTSLVDSSNFWHNDSFLLRRLRSPCNHRRRRSPVSWIFWLYSLRLSVAYLFLAVRCADGSVYRTLFPFAVFNRQWKMENEHPFFIFNEKLKKMKNGCSFSICHFPLKWKIKIENFLFFI